MAKQNVVEIKPPNMRTIEVVIEGTAPYVQNKFSAKARQMMRDKQEQGSTAAVTKRAKSAKDFDECYEQSKHVCREADGTEWCGIPAPSFRKALISACRTIGFTMTLAKLAVFTEADGFDHDDGTPLVRITRGEPTKHEALVRNDSGVADIRARAMWAPGWRATLRIVHDADIMTQANVVNLLARAGIQVGIGEGRPDSKDSAGMGWGTFRILGEKEAA